MCKHSMAHHLNKYSFPGIYVLLHSSQMMYYVNTSTRHTEVIMALLTFIKIIIVFFLIEWKEQGKGIRVEDRAES